MVNSLETLLYLPTDVLFVNFSYLFTKAISPRNSMNLKVIKLLLIRFHNTKHQFRWVFLLLDVILLSFAVFSAFFFFFKLRLLCSRSITILSITLVGMSQVFPKT